MKVIVFAPHAALWIHAFPEALIADSLNQEGHEIVYVSCGEALSELCVPMAAHGMTPATPREKRLEICTRCKKNDAMLRREFGFSGPSLESLLSQSDQREVDRIAGSVQRDAVTSLIYDGIPVGQIALYQVILHHKRPDTNFTDGEWEEYKTELRNTLCSLIAARKLFAESKPDRVVLYNALYSVNHVVVWLGKKLGVPCYFLHASSTFSKRLQRIIVGRDNPFGYMRKLLTQWPRFEDVPCTPKQLARATDHVIELLRGQSIFVYSNRKAAHFDARRHFGLNPSQKLLVATMSSNDEYAAGILVGAQAPLSGLLFDSQIEWIRALIEFARNRPDIFLVVRVHPREFPNRRDARKSRHAVELESALVELPSNVAVNWPAENISIFDLADQTDLFLNAWSSTGRDIPMLGLPVVAYSDKLPLYPANLNGYGETRASYFAAVDAALDEGWSFERARKAYRWAVFEFIRSTVDLSDSYSELEQHERSVFHRILHRVGNRIDPDFTQHLDIRRRAPRLRASAELAQFLEAGTVTTVELQEPEEIEQVSREVETQALQKELKRLGEALYPTSEARSTSRLYKLLTGSAASGRDVAKVLEFS